MDGNTRIGGGAVNPNPGPTWKAVATGDFDGDGKSDILWQNTDGQAAIWEMNGNTRTGGGAISVNPGPTWRAVGTGDFNGDGNADVLWQNKSTGQVSVWEMDGNTRTGGGAVGVNPGRLGMPSERVISTRVAFPTSFSRIRTRARCRSGKWTGTLGSAAGGQRPSRAELACHRDRRRRFRHPFSKHQWPNLDLGDGREYSDRRRGGQRQSRAELASGRLDLKLKAMPAEQTGAA
jgi:hypothetical protein